MRVSEPRFDRKDGAVWCEDCPFTDDSGNQDMDMIDKCCAFSVGRTVVCPTRETYAEACALATTTDK